MLTPEERQDMCDIWDAQELAPEDEFDAEEQYWEEMSQSEQYATYDQVYGMPDD
jgi:hypothetical protein|tara:strand:+ start:3038 stop:3199 length:162 start_codon:yes stop_codon:yes gene_type:complete